MLTGKNKWYLLLILTTLILTFSGWKYLERAGTFSFGDEWNNFMAGFFMLKGRTLFSEIFYNHQPLPAYISYIIQIILKPSSLYTLVLYHRAFVIIFSLLFSILLVFRFRFTGLFFVFVYEFSKYYVSGNLFLAENLLVYPLVYLFCIAWEKIHKKNPTSTELILSSMFAWFTIFSREPLAPLALIFYLIIAWEKPLIFIKRLHFIIFSILSIATLGIIGTSITQYIQQVIIHNATVIIPHEMSKQAFPGESVIKALFYPITILLEGKWNILRVMMIVIDINLLIFLFLQLIKKGYKEAMFIILILSFAALRSVKPGTMFYDAFHIVPWYGLLIMSIPLLAKEIYPSTQKNLIKFLLFIPIFISVLSPQSFIWEKIDRKESFNTNYVHYYIPGEVIRRLAEPTDTLFADLWDYLIHWQANLDSSYKYSVYIFSMRGTEKYDNARQEMFQKYPPDFYYTYCTKGVYESPLLDSSIKQQYVQLYRENKPSCIYIKKTKALTIPKERLQKIQEYNYSLPL